MAKRVEVLYFEGCPNHEPAVRRVREAMGEMGLEGDVIEVNIVDAAMAQEVGFLGSPSIRVDGVDIEPEERHSKQCGFGCRTYMDGGTRTGVPPVVMIQSALKGV